jgi:hypothetical protein
VATILHESHLPLSLSSRDKRQDSSCSLYMKMDHEVPFTWTVSCLSRNGASTPQSVKLIVIGSPGKVGQCTTDHPRVRSMRKIRQTCIIASIGARLLRSSHLARARRPSREPAYRLPSTVAYVSSDRIGGVVSQVTYSTVRLYCMYSTVDFINYVVL